MSTQLYWAIRRKNHKGCWFYMGSVNYGKALDEEYEYFGPFDSLSEAHVGVKAVGEEEKDGYAH